MSIVRPPYAATPATHRFTALKPSMRLDAALVGRSCVANDRCGYPPVPDGPVPLCSKHLREVYAFAQDMVARPPLSMKGGANEVPADTELAGVQVQPITEGEPGD